MNVNIGLWNRTAATTVALLIIALGAQGQQRHFSGFYGGIDLGSQNVIGGSLVEGVDVLAQDERLVTSFVGGFRYEFEMGLVLGGEIGYGVLDGDLSLSDAPNDLAISYESSDQTAIGMIVGFVSGASRDWLTYGYVSEVTREFDVTIRQQGVTFTQRDEQGMLRYGIGIEKRLLHGLHVRAALGSGRADFDGPTNIDPDEEMEYSAGVIWQF